MLVNNAGIPKRKPVFALTPEIVEDVMRINYFSPVRLTFALLDEIVARVGPARVRVVGRGAACRRPPSRRTPRRKAAISTWAECLQVDLRDTGVKMHVVYPGIIDTELFHLPDNDPLPQHRRRDAAGRRDGRAGARR